MIIETYAQSRVTRHDNGALFRCSVCHEAKLCRPEPANCTTGYGVLGVEGQEVLVCFACCAIGERARMIETGRATLYLTMTPAYKGATYGNAKLANWPGTLVFGGRYHTGRHNMARVRYDVQFSADGAQWYGVQYGDNTQICLCKRVKA